MHWFLKQELLLPTPVVTVAWDAERASRLYVAQRDGTLAACDFSYEYSVSLGDSLTNQATAVVIDGRTRIYFSVYFYSHLTVRWVARCPFTTL